MSDIVWDRLPLKKQHKLIKKINKLSHKLAKVNYHKPAHTNFKTKLKFYMCRMLKKSMYKQQDESLDCVYWIERGWLANKRPWKRKF